MKLLLGGSPCTHWSIAQTRNRETQPEGQGWELFRNYLIARERYGPDFYLYENNKSMAPAIRAQITAELGVEPILINSALVSAQSRQRLYWTNIPGVELPEDRGLLLLDILESGLPLREKGYALDANYYKGGASPLEHQSGKRLIVAEPVNVTADGKAQCLRATYYKDGIRNMVGNTIDRKTCVAQPVCLNSKSGRGGIPGLQPSLADRVYSIEGKGTAVTTAFHPYIAVPFAPIRVGTIESGTGSAGQGHRVYSADGKSKTLCGNGGGAGAKTGLYTAPYENVITCQTIQRAIPQIAEKLGYMPPVFNAYNRSEIKDKSSTGSIATSSCATLVFEGTAGKTYPVYQVLDGKIEIKGKLYDIMLTDGDYIIRKLTVRECMRLQTVPESFVFPVSDSQAYKMLGNGWTVDVIAHILSYCPGITTEPLDVLSMYDGMSCGHLALERLGAAVRRYCATEIDKYAIKTTQTNFPDTIQLGDAFQVREDEWWSFFACEKGV